MIAEELRKEEVGTREGFVDGERESTSRSFIVNSNNDALVHKYRYSILSAMGITYFESSHRG